MATTMDHVADPVQELINQIAQERQVNADNNKKTHELLQQLINLTKGTSKHETVVSQIEIEDNRQPDELLQQHDKLSTRRDLPSQGPDNVSQQQVDVGLLRSTLGSASSSTSARRTVHSAIIESYPYPAETIEEVDSLTPDSMSTSLTIHSGDEGATESICVQKPLRSESHDMWDLQSYIREYPWQGACRTMLDGLYEDENALQRDWLFPLTTDEAEADRSCSTRYSICDVGKDGAPLPITTSNNRNTTTSSQIWEIISTTNSDPGRRPATGRIVIIREPSPKLYAALHYTMKDHFDMDELFNLLKGGDRTVMLPHRAFSFDKRHRRTFVIAMEYVTVVGAQCRPQKWQLPGDSDHDADLIESNTDRDTATNDNKSKCHVPLSRCSSVVALSLEGLPIAQAKARYRDTYCSENGEIHDPFSPYRILSIQAYPDSHATTDTHRFSNTYLNGPEAFLYTVRDEFYDAATRLMDVYDKVVDLVDTPRETLFNLQAQEKLLFEDNDFSNSKKLFWAHQTLGVVNQDITVMVDLYHDVFTEAVWNGTDLIVWPTGNNGTSSSSPSPRYEQFRKRMASLRSMIDEEIAKLEYIRKLNLAKMQSIRVTLDNLSAWTTVMEARRSTQQNRSIMLLTFITISFLPLSFVTSVFGMTNMSQQASFVPFAATVVAVCIPTYAIVGSLATDRGLGWWRCGRGRVGELLRRGVGGVREVGRGWERGKGVKGVGRVGFAGSVGRSWGKKVGVRVGVGRGRREEVVTVASPV